ncbi:MAG: hypothetical protein LC667_02455 [Thioalkalivibrio sp.]|nr:hypothetical protein [Thioalkalivibrio sp.]
MIAGLSADVAALRAALDLAETIGAVVDHVHGDALARGLAVLQGSGWSSSCLHEVRNRATLVVLVGRALPERYPRLMERVLEAGPGLFTERRRVVMIDALPLEREGIDHLPCSLSDLGTMAATLRALLTDRPVMASPVPGLSLGTLRDFLDSVVDARYSVFVTAPGLMEFPHAELALEALSGFIQAVNGHTRSTLVSLGGGDGDTGACNVAAWKSGFPLRVDFSQGPPIFDPHLHSTARLAQDGCDALLWLSSVGTHTPPQTAGVDRIVLARPDVPPAADDAVYIPVGIPGVDYEGHVFRGDGTGVIPLTALREATYPSAVDVIRGLLQRLTGGVAPC